MKWLEVYKIKNLTIYEQSLYLYLYTCRYEGYPTIKEMAEKSRMSKRQVSNVLNTLKEKGLVARDEIGEEERQYGWRAELIEL